MPTPDYITDLRRVFGNGLLLLPAVTAVVLDGDPGPSRVLLGRRSDTGAWAVPAGIVEPGEQPAAALVREVLEETGVDVVPERLALLTGATDVVYPNGDRCQFITMTFRCRYVGGTAFAADDESTDVGWFALDALPDLDHHQRRRISCALPVEGPTVFDT